MTTPSLYELSRQTIINNLGGKTTVALLNIEGLIKDFELPQSIRKDILNYNAMPTEH